MSESTKSAEKLSPKKRALLELLLKEKRAVAPVSNMIPRREPSPYAPLSFAQEQMWFLDQLNPGSSYYNLPVAIRFKGKLNVATLELSLSEILRRHEVLRATYDVIDGKPAQIIHEGAPQPLPVVDLSSLEAGEREAAAQRMRLEEARRPFDLKAGPIMRAKILRLSEDEHALLLTLHHICTDGWSMGVLNREMIALYEAFSAGRPSPLAELPVQYPDYAVWQRQRLQGARLEKSLSFWRRQLKDAAVGLDLPTDKPRQSIQSNEGGVHLFDLPQNITRAVQTFSQREGVTLFITLLAAFKSLLFRYTHQSDILVGMPVANRVRPEIESLIGIFINTFVLRTQVEGAESFRSLVARVRETALAAQDHQELPIEKLVEELQPDRDLSHNPLFQVMFNFMFSKPSTSLPGLVVNTEDVYNKTSKFDLELNLWDTGDRISGAIEYSSDLFEAETINRLCANFQRLLSSAVASPDDPVTALPIVSDAERRQFDAGFGAGPLPGPETHCWHELFERRAAREPSAIALTCGDFSLSYGALDRRSSQAASLMSRRGVGPETVVALLSERTPELVIWMLAAHRAGGAYLPLDPNWPASRLAHALRSAAPALLVSSAGLEAMAREALAGAGCDAPLLKMGDEGEGATGDEASEFLPRAALQDLAYIIYTSGSTGEPKGAMLTHAGLLNHLRAKVEDLGLGPSDVVAQTASQCFDISVWQMWAPLLVGASIRLVPDETAHDPSLLLGELDRSGVTVAELVPSVLGATLDHLETAGAGSHPLTTLRWLLVTGEALPPQLCRRWLARYPSALMMNAYGPTECSDDVTHEVISIAPAEQARRIPIGRALRGIRLHVVDSRGAQAPIGVIGELWCGGAGVGRGYVGRPDLTAERFTPDPFSVEAGARLYRTGDLARWALDGRLEFLGRIDHQVKVRGFRIELGEIEAALRRHEAVGAAAVVAGEDRGATRLVAYVVGRGSDAAPGAAELRDWLGRELPNYMTPSAFVALDSLPLTENGKLDRKALPEPEAVAEREPIAPRTSAEEIVAGVWAETLSLERVGVEENFFELGGHSLLATQVVTRVRQYFGVDLPLRAIFESPTVAGLARRIEEARGARADVMALPSLAAAPGRGAESPLSFAQQRLWFLDQLTPDNPSYNIPVVVRLQGRLDGQAFERSLNEIVNRHEVLRATYPAVDGRPAQVIAPTLPLAIPVIDLQESPQDAREARARLLAAEEARRPFNLANGPLLRAKLLRLDEEDHVALLVIHHIVFDGWSMGVLVKEFAALYEAYSQGRRSPLDELPIQYADFAVWQREWLGGEILEAQLAYWRRQLTGLPILNLPTDHPRSVIQTYRGAMESLLLPASLTDSLKELSQRHGVTLFMTLLAAFQTLLMRYTGQEDVTVGSPVANRGRAELEGLLGFFVNTLALRTDLNGDPTFAELLGRVREVAMGAYAHQDLPFEKLVEEIQPDRDMGRHPLFQVMMVLQNARGKALELPGLNLGEMRVESATTKFDLTLSLADTEQGLAVTLEYSTDLFESATIKRMLGHFETLLEAVVANPQRRLSDLPLLTETERRLLLVEWNDTRRDYPRESSIQDLFARQVERTPNSIALSFGPRTMTYRALERRSNQLAHYLRARGVGPESVVAISMERSIEMVVGLLAILKAGGAYLPLDPSYPAERLSFMLQDMRSRLLLTEEHLSKHLAPHVERLICLDTGWREVNAYPQKAPVVEVSADNLAYVIYTSGSTGKPKGIGIPHRGIARLVCNTDYARLSAEDRVAQASNASFDAATFEIWGALLSGARLVGIAKEEALSPAEYAARLDLEKITTIFLTTALFNQLAQAAPSCFSGVRHLLVGGEAVDPQWVRAVLREGPPERFLNVYGPTESTTFATWQLLKEVSEEARTAPIGRGIANTKVYALDRQMHPAPLGVTGELYLGGDGLARGYLNRPEVTAERFVPHPYSSAPGARLYRTGDLARYNLNGEIEFIGRVDHQVKLRGFRIELGEIEAELRRHEGVRDSVVIIREEGGEKSLAAYVAVEPCVEVSVSEFRRYLKEKLPEYMVPSSFVMMSELPLTPNGKVNRGALPAPDLDRPEVEAAYVAPRTQAEEVIAAIWSQALGIERVGVYDNFFELGGHSLLVTRVVSRVREAFGVELPMRVLFESPVLAEFAGSIAPEIQGGGELDTIPLAPISRDEPIPLTLSQQEMLAYEQMNPGTAANNVPVMMRLRGELDLAALEWGLGEIIRRHEILRTTFETSRGVACQIIHPPAPIQIPVLDLIGASIPEPETYARRFANEEGRRPFDLAIGPLLRAMVMRLSADEHLLLLVMHHIIIDPWSLSLLMRELTTLCGAFGQGERGAPPPLPDLPVQFADYAVWERKWLQGEVLKRLQNYWRERLGGRLPSLNLPRKSKARRKSKAGRSSIVAHGASCPVELPASLSERIKTLSLNEGATSFISLLAAFKATLYQYTGNTDIIVTSPMANRHHLEVESLIGFFANPVALRTTFDECASFRELLRNVRETALGAYMRQALPLGKVIEALGAETDLSEDPFGRANFALLTIPVSQQEAGKLGSQILDVEVGVVSSDLSLTLWETSEGFRGRFTYKTDLFDEVSALQLVERFQRLLQSAVSDPDQKLSDLKV